MIDADPSLQAAERLSPLALIAYLQWAGWAIRPSRIAGVAILTTTLPDDEDQQVRIVLPQESGFSDEKRRVADALRTIEAVEERSIAEIVDQASHFSPKEKKKDAESNSGSAKRHGSYPIAAVGADPNEVKRLKAMRIRTVERLLEAAKNPIGRRQLAEKTGIDEKRLLAFANAADRMRIKGMGKEYASILPAVGVDTVRELKYRNPEKLALAIWALNKARKKARDELERETESLKEEHPASLLLTVTRWIEEAKKLPLIVIQ